MSESINLLITFAILCGIAIVSAYWCEYRWRIEQIARASHELRGPLTAAQLALHGLHCQNENDLMARVHAIEHELGRAQLALTDLAAAQEGQRNKDHIELIEIGDLLKQIVLAWQPLAQAKGTELSLEECYFPIQVCGNKLRLLQVFGNLLENAIKHGGDAVTISVEKSDSVQVIVHDNGSGLFNMPIESVGYNKANKKRRRRGLSIASEIIARYGGKLTSIPKASGTFFVVEIPEACSRDSVRHNCCSKSVSAR